MHLDLPELERLYAASTKGKREITGRWHSGKNIATYRSQHVPVAIEIEPDGYWDHDTRTIDEIACCNAECDAALHNAFPAIVEHVRHLEAHVADRNDVYEKEYTAHRITQGILAGAIARTKELEAPMEKYGQHVVSCPAGPWVAPGPCDCGLDAAKGADNAKS